MTNQELTYWVTLSLMPNIWTSRKNEIYVKCFEHEPRLSIIDLFEVPQYWSELGLSDIEINAFQESKTKLVNNAFLVEDLLSQGYSILPIHSDEYPEILKRNLGKRGPTVIYTKGNKDLLKGKTVAIVGSRKADEISLQFTDNIARTAVAGNKVVVSGFAKGVDKQALDSALKYNGKSIIVLPQGIMTFASGFKQYYRDLVQGNVLVLSSFAPRAPWSKELAMARNPLIYGLSSEIFVAQSDDKGGTWSGVIDGLKKEREIYVRVPEKDEVNANVKLISKGAIPVDINGNKIDVNSLTITLEVPKNLNEMVISLLYNGNYRSTKDFISELNLDITEAKLRNLLKTIKEVESFKHKGKTYYRLINNSDQSLQLFG
jgi:DNA protecting protein DprA